MKPVQPSEHSLENISIPMGMREDFGLHRILSSGGLEISLFLNGGIHLIRSQSVMLNQVEGHPFQGGLDRMYFRVYGADGIQTVPVSGSTVPVQFDDNGVEWRNKLNELTMSMRLVADPELPVLYRICRVENRGDTPRRFDWLYGQDVGLADHGALKSNEAYACQYIDHKILSHATAGQVVISRNNLHHDHPVLLHLCFNGAASASTDGLQFFGSQHRITHQPLALHAEALPNVVKQYEGAYAGLLSVPREVQPGERMETVFAMQLIPVHHDTTSNQDLSLVDELITRAIPPREGGTATGQASAFFSTSPIAEAEALLESELVELCGRPWRHEERGPDGELYSFFVNEDVHAVLPAKEATMERTHGHILKTSCRPELDRQVVSVSCYGTGVFGSQFAVGNTTFGRYTSLLRNSLGLDRSSGIRFFLAEGGGWTQLGFPSLYCVTRDTCRWVYKLGDLWLDIIAGCEAESIVYSVRALKGELPAMRATIELCGDANEFDAAPEVHWNDESSTLFVRQSPHTAQRKHFPESVMALRAEPAGNVSVGGAAMLGGATEPYAVLDLAAGSSSFTLHLTGDEMGEGAALERLSAAESGSWTSLLANVEVSAESRAAAVLSDTLQWYAHNAMIHYEAPRGIEQYGGAAWGTRDVCQGPLEFFLSLRHDEAVEDMLCRIFAHQFEDTGAWPQWFMFEGFNEVKQLHAHGDIVFWPIKALCEYVEQTSDFGILDREIPYTRPEDFSFTENTAPLHDHLRRAYQNIVASSVGETALPSYGDGDWNDALQPANQDMKTNMVSGWTAGLSYQTLSMLVRVWEGAGHAADAEEVKQFTQRLAGDFRTHVIRNGVTAGFVLFEDGGEIPLLHPDDQHTGIQYRLLCVNRSILSGLFTPEEAADHLALAETHLKFPDGMRLMNKPPEYTGGTSTFFQRAETAAHFGREIGLQYVHAHLRYCEALAKVGRPDDLLKGLLTVSPVAIQETVPNARPRQANLYFSSSDADVNDRYEAAARIDELRQGRVGALGGWRLYSSGPGIYIGLVISRLFGIRRSFGNLIVDPVLPRGLNGAELRLDWNGKSVMWRYHVQADGFAPSRVEINGRAVQPSSRTENPYRNGGWMVPLEKFETLLSDEENTVEIWI